MTHYPVGSYSVRLGVRGAHSPHVSQTHRIDSLHTGRRGAAVHGARSVCCTADVMRVPIAIALLLVAGCSTTLPADPAGMSPEQLREIAKDRSAVLSCVSTRSLAVDITAVYVVIDRSVISSGSIDVGNDCRIQVVSE